VCPITNASSALEHVHYRARNATMCPGAETCQHMGTQAALQVLFVAMVLGIFLFLHFSVQCMKAGEEKSDLHSSSFLAHL